MVGKSSVGLILACLIGVGGALALTGVSRPAIKPLQTSKYSLQRQSSSIRSGIVFKITQAQIASDGTITATFQITDPQGVPLDLDGAAAPGPVTVGMTLATIYNDHISEQYINHVTQTVTDPATGNTATQGALDSGGTFQPLGGGLYTYTLNTKIPDFDPTATHSIGGQAERDLTEFDLGVQGIDDVYSWVPDGSPVTAVREVVGTPACNQCHNPLAMHGGARQKVAYCILCHNPQSDDPFTGNSLDMSVMIHKIHRGPNLPSVKAGGQYQLADSPGRAAGLFGRHVPARSSRMHHLPPAGVTGGTIQHMSA